MKQRIVTGLLAGIVYLFFLFVGSVPFALFAAVIAIISFTELAKMKKLKRSSFEVIAGSIIVAVTVLGTIVAPMFSISFAVLFLKLVTVLSLFLLAVTVFTRNRFQFEQTAYVLFSVIYIGFSFYLLVALRMQSLKLILFIQILIWATDSGAYFIGRQWGRRKLAPHISPNKTIEGSAGALISAIAVALIFQLIVRTPLFSSWGTLLAISVLISIAGQLGDLAESAVKRYFMVKDSGTLLPGHGGLFDRFDSLIFVLPVLFLLGVIH